ncbi:MAG: response regulator transcription factor [Chloroflexi bacterium]|nr:response regulator transcription factor [Chloroflexota bacterium]
MATILVVDDEENIVELARLYLSQEGYRVVSAGDGRRALELAQAERPDLVVLDLMLPEVDGYEVCRQLRRQSDVPIIMLTARGEDVDRIVGLEMGADDYMVKPFNPRELVARVRAVLRRGPGQAAEALPETRGHLVRVGDLEIDVDRREARLGDDKLDLRLKEFDLLLDLAEHKEMVLTREKLLERVWGYDYAGDTRTVDVHVAQLRKKLSAGQVSIETVRGVGYRLVERG